MKIETTAAKHIGGLSYCETALKSVLIQLKIMTVGLIGLQECYLNGATKNAGPLCMEKDGPNHRFGSKNNRSVSFQVLYFPERQKRQRRAIVIAPLSIDNAIAQRRSGRPTLVHCAYQAASDIC